MGVCEALDTMSTLTFGLLLVAVFVGTLCTFWVVDRFVIRRIRHEERSFSRS